MDSEFGVGWVGGGGIYETLNAFFNKGIIIIFKIHLKR